jgi:hypothetical protein
LYEHFEQVNRTKKTKPKFAKSLHRVCGQMLCLKSLKY